MPGITGVQQGTKPVEVLKSQDPTNSVKTENASAKEEVKDTFDTPKEKNTFDNFASGPTSNSKLPPGEAMTAKGLAYLKMKEAQKLGIGEARTAKGEAYLKWKEAQGEKEGPGQARTAKGEAYQKMMQAEQASQKVAPGEAPRVKKHSGIQH